MTVRDVGLALVRAAPWLDRVGRWVYGRLPAFLHDNPTSRLRAYFSREESVTFVQIGAFDGVEADPIRSLILDSDRWHGVLVEPQPDAFEQLCQNYLGRESRLQLLNLAISDRSGEETLFCIPEAKRALAGLPVWVGGIASFDAEHLHRHLPHAELVSYRVKTATFDEVADRLPGGHVDVVIIDVEGHERPILESIDLDRHQVKFIMYEHKHLSESDRSAVESRLQAFGFSVKRFGWDTVAYRSSLAQQPRSLTRPEA
jgi:FkbM family methyltransferase